MERPEVFDVDMTLTRIFIRPQGQTVGQILIFNRDTEGVKLSENHYVPLHATKRTIYGIIGVIKLILCKYLIVISRRSRVDADIRLPHSLVGVWRVDKVNLIPLAPGKRSLTRKQREMNEKYILMVLSAFNTKDFYYSNIIDLTQSVRRSHMENNNNKMNHDRDSDSFIWNAVLLSNLIQIKGLDFYCIRLTNGFVQVKYLKYQAEVVVIALVSRRRNKRIGTRFFTTGIDHEGEAANMVETEIIVEGSNVVCSFIILSGSVPLLWDQWPDLSCTPKPVLSQPDSQYLPFLKHFENLFYLYGDTIIVIDLSKYCAHGTTIHQLYKHLALKSENIGIKFVEVDLKVVTNDKFNFDENVIKYIKEMGFTWVQNDIVIAPQKGTIRVSSIDSTDSTNFVQSILVNIILPNMLKTTVGPDIYKTPTDFELQGLQKSYNKMWLAQGDVLAYHYMGTCASKTYLLDPDYNWRRRGYELWIPVKRWYINNVEDAFKQDSFDLVMGKYKVETKKSYPSHSNFEYFMLFLTHYIIPGIVTFSTLLLINVITEFYNEEQDHEEEDCVTVLSFTVIILWLWFYSNLHYYANEPTLYVKKPH